MYPALLAAHNGLRWLVLLAGAVAVATALSGFSGAKPWTKQARLTGVIFVGLFDLQFLIGIALYVVSPLLQAARADMAAAMKDHEARFFTVEHGTEMLVALILAHLGSVLAKKAIGDRAKYRRAALYYGASLLVVLAAIPWWRPLFR